ncbi:hypothetical protein [Burkholderia gladioli]|uniref:hypothetical protein n=1 Tax=Burkholderia gladioli TaxID=28095 RepID=UPI0016410AD8|nr:hypothetical protein [Burkholderia gladioli]
MTNNTTAALTNEQAASITWAIRAAKEAGFAADAEVLNELLTSPRAAVPHHVRVSLECTAQYLEYGNDPKAAAAEIRACLAKLDAAPAAPVADLTPAENAELASMTRMFHAACTDLGLINEALGLDPDDGGAEPILDAIQKLKNERDQWADAGYAAQAVAADGASTQRCNLGVGCDEAGVCYASAHGDASQCGRAAVSPATASGLPAWFDTFLTNVCEIPDRSSPEGEPDAIIATLEELKNCALNAIEECAGDEPATADERAHNACCPFCGSDDFYTDWALGKRQALCNSCEAAGPTEETDEEAIASFTRMRASQAAAPAEAREPLVLWQDGTGMLWDTYSHGKWMHRFVSPHGWDAHGVAQHLYGKGYAGHLEVRAVWSGNYAVPADAGEAVARKPDGWYYRERVDGQWAEWKPCGKSTVERYQYASDMQFAPVYRVPAEAGESVVRQVVIDWAVERWTLEVKDRPLNNVNRRPLDDAWRQLIRYLGADDISLLGARHDELVAARAQGAQGGKGGEA